MKLRIASCLVLSSIIGGASARAADPAPVSVLSKSAITLGGTVRFRGEAHDNLDFLGPVSDTLRFGLMRFRMDFTFQPRPDVSVFLEPQATRTWGKNEIVAGTSVATSGGVQDSRMDLHQGYLNYRPSERVEALVGRQILSYGDELLVGAQDWNNAGRAFDALKGAFRFGSGRFDLFWSKLTERNDTTAGPGDRDFYGLYSSWVVADWMKAADVYALHLAETGTDPTRTTTAVGARAKSAVGRADYRAEFTAESAAGAAENQIDLELGYTISPANTRFAVEGFRATRGFDQLFATTHKWLGYADYFARKNIEGLRFGISSELSPGLSLFVDEHLFFRTDSATSAVTPAGTAYGAAGSARAMANELDVVLKAKLNDLLLLSLGGARVDPKGYMTANRGPDSGYFYYAELGAQF